MRILFVLENYLPHIGGVEIVFKNLCEGLAARGHKVTVLTHHIPGTRRKETLNGVRIVRIPCMDSRYLFTFAAIPAAIRYAKDADIVHTTTFNGAPPAWLAARARRKPVVITVHESWIGKWRAYTDFPAWKAWVHEALERAVFIPRYDRYACVSDSTAQQLHTALPKAGPNILTIHNGFDASHWTQPVAKRTLQTLRKSMGLRGKHIVFGYGRPGTSKGFPHLIEAFPIIKRRIPNAVLLLILSKDKQYAAEISRMRRRADELGVGDSVMIIDPKPYKELTVYAHMADCIVVPSITEGFGYTTLESCATGTPVVASDTTSIPEVIHGKHLLVAPRDPRAIAKGVIAAKEGMYKTTPARVFPWSANIAAFERLYDELSRTAERTVRARRRTTRR